VRHGRTLLAVAVGVAVATTPPLWMPGSANPAGQARGVGPAARRYTTVEALRHYPGFFHLQNVVVRGELEERSGHLVLTADEHDIRVWLADGVRGGRKLVELRAQFIDLGRMEPDDPRARPLFEGRGDDPWPRPGEELYLRVTDVTELEPEATTPSIRALALEPWRFAGKKVTVTGNFRGRNLFGDLPNAPGKSRYDFVLRGPEGAIWVTGLRPRGRGFELDPSRRVDTDRWVEVTGTVVYERGLVRIEGTQIAMARAPETTPLADESAPPPPAIPTEVVFSMPAEGETDVDPAAPIRVQFSRGLDESSIAGRIRVGYVGDAAASELPVQLRYDAATRAIELRLREPLEPFRTVRVEVLDGIRAFDGAPVTPWTLTFSVGD
jgi:hypothetical protein